MPMKFDPDAITDEEFTATLAEFRRVIGHPKTTVMQADREFAKMLQAFLFRPNESRHPDSILQVFIAEYEASKSHFLPDPK